jgi:hypothetical protein
MILETSAALQAHLPADERIGLDQMPEAMTAYLRISIAIEHSDNMHHHWRPLPGW